MATFILLFASVFFVLYFAYLIGVWNERNSPGYVEVDLTAPSTLQNMSYHDRVALSGLFGATSVVSLILFYIIYGVAQ